MIKSSYSRSLHSLCALVHLLICVLCLQCFHTVSWQWEGHRACKTDCILSDDGDLTGNLYIFTADFALLPPPSSLAVSLSRIVSPLLIPDYLESQSVWSGSIA